MASGLEPVPTDGAAAEIALDVALLVLHVLLRVGGGEHGKEDAVGADRGLGHAHRTEQVRQQTADEQTDYNGRVIQSEFDQLVCGFKAVREVKSGLGLAEAKALVGHLDNVVAGRTTAWQRKNPWFDRELLPELRRLVRELMLRSGP